MSEFMFEVGRGRLDAETVAKLGAIAKRHDAVFTHANIPGNGWQSWFSTDNRGEPFDGQRANAVRQDIDDAGIDY